MGVNSRIFAPDVLEVFSPAIEARQLTHHFTTERFCRDGSVLPIQAVHNQLTELQREIKENYERVFQRAFDPFSLGDTSEWVHREFKSDRRFQFALQKLEIAGDPGAIYLPWWNELVAMELSYDEETHHCRLGLRHSYETQVARRGGSIPGISVAVLSLVETKPDADFPQGALVLGLRGGESSYPNCYHWPAGALSITNNFLKGKSVYETFVESELLPELGLGYEDVSTSSLLCRFHDRVVGNDVNYTFHVHTRLSPAEVLARWRENSHEDRAEHSALEFLPATAEAALTLISTYYQGAIPNSRTRTFEERKLLHCGALPLLARFGLPLSELETRF
jgi:hypothetical protein